MTIVLVILAVLILLAVLFLIYYVSEISKSYRNLIGTYYNAIIDSMFNSQKNIITKVETLTTTISSQQQEVIKLTTIVEKSNTYCKTRVDSLKHTIATLDGRLTAPIDKINDTHNRIKTLGKGATSTEELRTVVANVVSTIATEAVDSVCQKCAPKAKTTKKVTKEQAPEVKD